MELKLKMKNPNYFSNSRGFTLIETMVASTLLIVVIMLSTEFIQDLTKKNNLSQNKAQKEAILSSWLKMQTKYFSTLMVSLYDPSMSMYEPIAAAPGTICPMPQNRRALYDSNWVKIGATAPVCADLASSTLATNFTIGANGCSTVTTANRPTCTPWRSVTKYDPATGDFDFNVGSEAISGFRGNSTDLIVWRPIDNTASAVDNTNTSGAALGQLGYSLDRILLSRCMEPANPLPTTFSQVMGMPRLIYHSGAWKCCPVSGYTPTNPQAGFGNDPSSCVAITANSLSGTTTVTKLTSTQYWPTVVMVMPDATNANIKFIPNMADRKLVYGVGFFVSFNDFANPTMFKSRTLMAVNDCATKYINSQTKTCPSLIVGGATSPFANWSSVIAELNNYSSVDTFEMKADTLLSVAGSSFVRFGTRSNAATSNNNNNGP